MKKKILAALLSAAMVMSSSSVALAAGTEASATKASGGVWSLTKVEDGPALQAAKKLKNQVVAKDGSNVLKSHADDEVVRVSIILDDEATTSKYSTQGIGDNTAAMQYRASLKKEQDVVLKKIQKKLNGKKLDVVWNLTLAANIISANVEYGDIGTIESVDGVASVILERKYEPAVTEISEADPTMATSGEMIGSAAAWADGYTGAGSRIAIIDSGIDDDHQSFDGGALDHSLAENAEALGVTEADYLESLDLLDEEEIDSDLKKLNVYGNDFSLTAADLFRSDKIAFGYNYVSQSLDITHENDGGSEHGSHVAGIAAANRYIPSGDTYENALDSVYVQGVAPDAQLLVMKVFGVAADGSTYSDGAYDSDYMAAIEDAIILGADSVNLSLGSVVPGFEAEYDYDYQDILDSLVETDTVVSISAGNNASVGDNSYQGASYTDDNSFNTMGSPGTYTNSLSVASVDNVGMTGEYIKFGDAMVFFNESVAHQKALSTLASEEPYEYVIIDGIGTAAQVDAVKDLISGKIAMISRGDTTFVEKCTLAAEAGAIAVIIYNNEPGTLTMNLDDYAYEAPAVFISQENGYLFMQNATGSGSVTYTDTDEETGEAVEAELSYFTGTLTIPGLVGVNHTTPEYYTMSDYSSMGTPSSLTLKPEITAPGGNIYSVNGAHNAVYVDNETGEESLTGIVGDSTTYENMSGTSMAAPQIAGMAAVVAQYINENGLAEQEGLTVRALAQSLLMATAEPAIDEYDSYYSILKQGAGIANVGNAVTAACYIMMDEEATASYADGKVKAELGDDPDRTGVYSYSFTVNNMTDTEQTYTPSTALFFQYPEVYEEYDLSFMLNYTSGFWGYADSYLVDGAEAEQITVPAHGFAEVTVNLALSDDEKEYLEDYFENGTYVEGYTFLTPEATDEGALDVEYSIPILAYYGNYSDASMYDEGSLNDWYYGLMRYPYSYDTFEIYSQYTGGDYIANFMDIQFADPEDPEALSDLYTYTSNPYETVDENALYRQAINSNTVMTDYSTRNIDTAGVYTHIVRDSQGKIVDMGDLQFGVYPAFYYPEYGCWLEAGEDDFYIFGGIYSEIGKTPAELGFKEGDSFSVSALAIPEYYTKGQSVKKGTIVEWLEDGTLGKGVLKSTGFVVDDTAPAADETSVVVTAGGETERSISVVAQDNQYIAYAAVLSSEFEMCEGYVPEQTEENQAVTCEFNFDLADLEYEPTSETYYILVADYAGNESLYAAEYVADFTIPDSVNVVVGETAEITAEPADIITELTWTSADETIATVDASGVVTGVKPGKTTVTAALEGGLAVTCDVRVLFTDVAKESAWFFEPVYWALDNGITTGASATEFKPAADCTRAQFVTFLYRAAGEPEVTIDNPFTDVKESAWYYNAVLWAYENGITTGSAADRTKFLPNQTCKRCEVVTFMYRYAGEPEVTAENPFKDVKESQYYYNAVLWAYANEITTGKTATEFAPKDVCVRREVVTFLYRAFGPKG